MKPRTDEIGVVLERFDVEHVIEHGEYAKKHGATSKINASGFNLGVFVGLQTVQLSEREISTLTDLVFDASWTYRQQRQDILFEGLEIMLGAGKQLASNDAYLKYLAHRTEELWLKETEVEELRKTLYINHMESRALLSTDQT